RKIPIVFSDIMGLEPGQSVGVRPEDVILAMKGHVKDGYEFDQTKTLSQEDEKYNENPTFDDRVHVLVCILNANTAQFSPEVLQKIMEIKQEARTNVFPGATVHRDHPVGQHRQISTEIMFSPQNILKCVFQMQEFSASVGIPVNFMYPVQNYSDNTYNRQDDIDALLLEALNHIIHFGDDFLDL
ncbi:hypothetical protein NL108_018617, partial [Boleophthalmus pectinirostris]